MLIDTAGVRRRARVEDVVERASVAKTLQAIDEAHVVIMVLDAHDTVAEQDASVLGHRARARPRAHHRDQQVGRHSRRSSATTIQRQLALKLDFVPFAPLHFISARHGTGVGELMQSTVRAYEAAMRTLPTASSPAPSSTRSPCTSRRWCAGRRIKLRYAHQGGRNPPRIVIHGNQTTSVPEAYTRYLANVFRKTYDLFATPVVDRIPHRREPFRQGAARRAPAAAHGAPREGAAAPLDPEGGSAPAHKGGELLKAGDPGGCLTRGRRGRLPLKPGGRSGGDIRA